MIVQANALHLPLSDASVHCVVTSPPYWGLREYDGEHQQQLWPDGWRGQLGMEPTPAQFLGHMVAIFREVRRVLRPDGTLWLNMGDSRATKPFYDGDSVHPKWAQARSRGRTLGPNRGRGAGVPEKNLIGMPWRLALALQADGWYLRSEIIWAKATPMPESVRDRPTLAHEHIFLLSQSPRYYYDDFGSREPASGGAHARGHGVNPKAVSASSRFRIDRNPASQTPGRIRAKQNRGFSAAVTGLVRYRRMRTIWALRSEQYRGKHYAAFPRSLAARAITAGTSEHGVCSRCGAPWVRVVDRPRSGDWSRDQAKKRLGINSNKRTAPAPGDRRGNLALTREASRAATGKHDDYFLDPVHVGWKRTCDCDCVAAAPALVLDPFAGTGTVGEVAVSIGRQAVLVDVAYQKLQRERLGLLALAAGVGA